VIERAGYEVLTATDGVEGVEQVERHAARISVVLLDLLMPRLGGEEAMQAMRALQPRLPIVISSGFSDDVMTDRLLAEEGVAFLAKPYHNGELLSALRDVLDRGVREGRAAAVA
jgi:CheY-like chemotaxis protein